MSKKTPNSKRAFICDHCGRGFRLKANLVRHILIHSPQAQYTGPEFEGLTCLKCRRKFKNKGLLMCHIVKIHEPEYKKNQMKRRSSASSAKSKHKHMCQACKIDFLFKKDLRCHIREHHFNLRTHLPYAEFKKVNQVWFENVMNSKNIVEIKKVAENLLIIRKLNENTTLKVGEHPTQVIDLHHLYPTKRLRTTQCKLCLKIYDKKYINKHMCRVRKLSSDSLIESLNKVNI